MFSFKLQLIQHVVPMTELDNLDFNFSGVSCEFFTAQSFNDAMESNVNDIIVQHINNSLIYC